MAPLLAAPLLLPSLALGAHAQADRVEDFDGVAIGAHRRIESPVGVLEADDRHLRVVASSDDPDELLLRVVVPRGVEDGAVEVRWILPRQARGGEVLALDMRRATRRRGLRVEWITSASGVRHAPVECASRIDDEFGRAWFELPPATLSVTLRVEGPPGAGVELDDVVLEAPRAMELLELGARHLTRPVPIGVATPVLELDVLTRGGLDPLALEAAELDLSVPGRRVRAVRVGGVEARSAAEGGPWRLAAPLPLAPGASRVPVELELGPVDGEVTLPGRALELGLRATVGGTTTVVVPSGEPARTAQALTAPGGAVSEAVMVAVPGGGDGPGGLVAVYGATDDSGEPVLLALRSAPGGLEPAADPVVADDAAGRARPVLLVDRSGRGVHLFHDRRRPDGTSRLEVCITEDLGASWSAPRPVPVEGVPRGELVRLVPGRGVAVTQGAWLLPVVRVLPGGANVPAMLVSRDQGGSFTLSEGVERPMTEVTLVELGDGAVLADCGIPGRGTRYLWSTLDLGVTWRNSLAKRRPLLPCGGHAAALVHVGRDLGVGQDWRLLFMNPATSARRPSAMTVRGCNDNGDLWPEDKALLLDGGAGVGAPVLAVQDERTAVALYRSSAGALVAQWLELGRVVDEPRSIFDIFGGPREGDGR